MKQDEQTTRVAFRRFPEGDLIALFVDESQGPGLCSSYQRIGQHSAASLELLEELEPVQSDHVDVVQLSRELTAHYGYRLEAVPS